MNLNENREWERTLARELATTLDKIRSEPAPLDSIERSLAAAENISMTSAAWRRGIKNALFCAVLLYSAIGLAIGAIIWFTTWQWIPVLLSTSGLLGLVAFVWLVTFVASLISRVRGECRLVSDVLLLDCGPHPARRLFQFNAGLFLVIGLCTATVGEGWFAGGIAVLAISFAAYWLIISTGRLKFYRAGIWTYWGLLRWERIKSVRWEGEHDATLLVQTSARIPMFGRGALPIAVEQKEAVQELIRLYLSAPE